MNQTDSQQSTETRLEGQNESCPNGTLPSGYTTILEADKRGKTPLRYLLEHNEGIDKSKLKPEYFENPKHGELFKIMLEMHEKGMPVNKNTVVVYKPELKGIVEEIFAPEIPEVKEEDIEVYEIKIIEDYKKRKERETAREYLEAVDNGWDAAPIIKKIEEIENIGSEGYIPKSWYEPVKLKPKQPIEWIVPDVLAKGLVGFFYGAGSAYKSLFALQLAILRAIGATGFEGLKWLDKFPVSAGKTVFLSAEDDEEELNRRLIYILFDYAKIVATDSEKMNMSVSSDEENLNMIKYSYGEFLNKNLLIIPREKWKEIKEPLLYKDDSGATIRKNVIIDFVKEFGAELIFIETFSRLTDIDENDNLKAAGFVSCLEEIKDATGAATICIDHAGKSGRTQKSDSMGQNSLRGAGSKMDNARFGIFFSRNGNDVTVTNSKNFKTKCFDEFTVTVNFPNVKLSDVKKTEKPLEEQIMAMLKERSINSTDIRAKLGKATQLVNNTLNKMNADGKIQRQGGKSNGKWEIVSEETPSETPSLYSIEEKEGE